MNSIKQFLATLKQNPEQLQFSDFLKLLEQAYIHKPSGFANGPVINAATENQGSAKVLSFGRLNGLTEQETLACFGEHYRSVLDSPEGSDHANIRAFMKTGWAGVEIPADCLTPKQ